MRAWSVEGQLAIEEVVGARLWLLLGRAPFTVVERVQLVHVSFAEGLLRSLMLRPPDVDDLGLLRDVRLEHRLNLAVELV